LTLIPAAAGAAVIHGSVSDPTGAVLPHARVEVIEGGSSIITVLTDGNGQYSLRWKPAPGALLRVLASGFRIDQKPITLAGSGRDLNFDFVLSLASLSEQVTVTSTGTPTPESQLGTTVTVLSSDDYQGTRDIQEGLRFVPGIAVTQTGQAGGTTSVFIRGCCVGANGVADATTVLIDGIPMNDIGGAVEFADIGSAGIDHVEVLRGPNSVLYGSDALAGVISLSTTRGSTLLPLLTYRIGGGNFGTYHQEGAVSGRHRKFDYFSDYSRFDSSNSIPDDGYHNGTLTANYGWDLSPGSSVRATLHHDRVASGQPGAIQLYGLPAEAEQANEDAYFGVTWEDKVAANWHSLVRCGGLRLRSQFAQFAPTGTPESGYTLGAPVTIQGANGYAVSGQALESNDGPPYPYTYPGSTDKDFVYAQSDYRFNRHILGLAAFRYEDERGYSGGPASSIRRGNYSYTLEVQGDISNRLFYTAGGGLDDNGLFGFAATPRVSLAWRAANGTANGFFSGTKLRASFGKGIKEPAIFDQLDSLYGLLESLPGGNQLISQNHTAPVGPENSRAYDGGVDQLLFDGRSRFSLTLFHNEFTNGLEYITQQGLIDLGVPSAIADAAAFGATVNSQEYRAQGVEAEVEYQIARDIFARAGYTYVDATIQRSFTSDAIGPSFNPSFPTIPIGIFSPLIGARPFRIPPHTGYFEAGYRHRRFFASLRGTLTGSRDDSDYLTDSNRGNSLLLPNRNLDGAYQTIDLAANYQATHYVAIESSFQNLLSEHYSAAFGYPSLPFTFRTGLKFTLGGESWPWK
jgi:iron complex outermembrane receptor protein/vitamin B12 transporter